MVMCPSENNAWRMWDAATGELTRTIKLPVGGWLSNDRKVLASLGANAVQFWEFETGRPLGTLALLYDGQVLIVSRDGHWRGVPQIDPELEYIIETDQGNKTLAPEDFEKEYGWRNDPRQATIAIPGAASR
jgi:hypothetical protein